MFGLKRKRSREQRRETRKQVTSFLMEDTSTSKDASTAPQSKDNSNVKQQTD